MQCTEDQTRLDSVAGNFKEGKKSSENNFLTLKILHFLQHVLLGECDYKQ